MSTAVIANEPDTAFEDDAFELLHCFYDGVDVYVRQRAVEIACADRSFDVDGKTVLIRKPHVQAAGDEAVRLLNQMLKQGLPDSAKQSVKWMEGCFQSKTVM